MAPPSPWPLSPGYRIQPRFVPSDLPPGRINFSRLPHRPPWSSSSAVCTQALPISFMCISRFEPRIWIEQVIGACRQHPVFDLVFWFEVRLRLSGVSNRSEHPYIEVEAMP